ncbi:23S rRNA pseudouridine2604 synthase [Halomonas campaniensis]|uniref:Dual-specificity RNA pseudouridine synthase RluF n=1 Tax=Halomonas campaniensis TaxID=213554 RepID=A0A7W5PAU0_9GAMM|nr:23S rRNA pseudouridine2604 synthase [Halomonas campaniensis]
MSDTERLSRRLARQLGCSRREAERYIAGGWVRVDGRTVETPQFRVADQRVELASGARAEEIPPCTLLYHAEAGLSAEAALSRLAADTHWLEDPDDRRLLQAHFRGQAVKLPLERGEAGLLVLTQDRRVARRLDEDRARLEQEWLVEVAGSLDDAQLARLREGTAVPGRRLAPGKVSWQSEQRLRFALKGMVPGQLSAMCEALGLEVISVKRLRIGGVSLARVPPGQWRYLRADERF